MEFKSESKGAQKVGHNIAIHHAVQNGVTEESYTMV